MNAGSLLLLTTLITGCGSGPAVVPEPRADAEPRAGAEPRASAEPLTDAEPRADTAPRCLEPRYWLVLGGGRRMLEPIDGAPALEHDMLVPVYEGDLDGDGIDDAIVNLGSCGNWGDCIHAIFLGCGEPGVFSLASEPDEYAFDFHAEEHPERPPTLWEAVRGEMDEADQITRVRWEIRNGRARPAEPEPQPAATCTPKVDDAVFITSGAGVDVSVSGSGFCQRAVPLLARVGDHPVSHIVLRADASGFSGKLLDTPKAGDRLRLGWADEQLRDTTIVFRPAAETND